MNKPIRIYRTILLGSILASVPLWADTVVLKNGQTLEGTVADQTPEFIDLLGKFGTVRIASQKVERIEQDSPDKVAAKLEKAEADKELADQMKAEGKVLYKGKWVLEDDKKKEETALAAARKKKQQERAQAEAKRADAAAKKKADDQKRIADRWRQQQQLANAYNNNARYANNNNGNNRNQRSGSNNSRNARNSSRNNNYGNTNTRNNNYGNNSNRNSNYGNMRGNR